MYTCRQSPARVGKRWRQLFVPQLFASRIVLVAFVSSPCWRATNLQDFVEIVFIIFMAWPLHLACFLLVPVRRPVRPPQIVYRAISGRSSGRTRQQIALALDGTVNPAAGVEVSPALAPPDRSLLPNGFLLVHKPQNWTSFDVVSRVRGVLEKHFKKLGFKFGRKSRLKVGHGGTLDPMATGLLVLGVGSGTKRMAGLLKGSKAYVARAQLGAETDTQDAEGQVTTSAPFEHVTLEELESAASALTGDILQRPPIYSALRKDGKRLYQLAREGAIKPEEVEKRPVTVHHLGVRNFDGASGAFNLDVRCSGGTYVRSLIEEMGRAVGSAAHMTALERTRHGPFCNDAEAEAARALGDAAEKPFVHVPAVFEDAIQSPERLIEAVNEAQAALDEALASMPPPPTEEEAK